MIEVISFGLLFIAAIIILAVWKTHNKLSEYEKLRKDKDNPFSPYVPDKLSECCNARIYCNTAGKRNVQVKKYICNKCGKDAKTDKTKVYSPPAAIPKIVKNEEI